MPEALIIIAIFALMGLVPTLCGAVFGRSEFGGSYLSGTALLIIGTGLLCRLLGQDVLVSFSVASLALLAMAWRFKAPLAPSSFNIKEIAPILLISLLIAVPHFWPALKVPDDQGGFAFVEPIFDLDHWVGGLIGVAADGLPAQHYQAPDAQFLYYFGAYMIPAAMLALFPGHIFSVMAALFVASSVALGLALLALLRDAIKTPLWRVLSVLVVFTGISITLRVHLSEELIETLTTKGWANATYVLMEPASYMLFWQWHHVMALALGLHLVSGLRGDAYKKSVADGVRTGVLGGACLACSPYVFLLILPTFCLQMMRAEMKAVLTAMAVCLIGAAVFYGDVVMALLHHDMSSNGGLSLRADLRTSVLDALSIGFLPLLACLFYRPVVDKTVPVIFLTAFVAFIAFDGEFSSKAFSVAQIFGGLLAILTLMQLKAQGRRRVFYGLLALVVIVASVNTVKSVKRTVKITGNVMALQDESVARLMEWVADHTSLADRVSVADDVRMFNYHPLGRRGVDAGEGRYARLGAQTASIAALEADRARSGSVAWGWDRSDYVVQVKCDLPLGLTGEHDIYHPQTGQKSQPPVTERHFTAVFETDCGTVWKAGER